MEGCCYCGLDHREILVKSIIYLKKEKRKKRTKPIAHNENHQPKKWLPIKIWKRKWLPAFLCIPPQPSHYCDESQKWTSTCTLQLLFLFVCFCLFVRWMEAIFKLTDFWTWIVADWNGEWGPVCVLCTMKWGPQSPHWLYTECFCPPQIPR